MLHLANNTQILLSILCIHILVLVVDGLQLLDIQCLRFQQLLLSGFCLTRLHFRYWNRLSNLCFHMKEFSVTVFAPFVRTYQQ